MRKNKVVNLTISDKLYTIAACKMFEYVVKCIRNYGEVIIYEVECQQCTGHKKCRLLISQIDNKSEFKYVAMINEDDEDEQYYWHTETFYLSKVQCKQRYYELLLLEKEKEINETEKLLKRYQADYIRFEELINALKATINE